MRLVFPLIVVASLRAQAAEPSACPTTDAVRESLSTMLTVSATEPLDVEDLGDRYSVTVAGSHRELLDPERLCDQRAKRAAVVAAVALTRVLEARAAPPVEVASPSTWRIAVEGHADVDVALAARAPVAAGGTARVLFGQGPWRIWLAVAGRSPVELDLGGGPRARLVRVPIDAGARLSWHVRWFELGAELGLSVTPLWVQGLGIDVPESSSRIELGLKLGVSARAFVSNSLGLMATVMGRWVPRPYPLRIDETLVGHLPSAWFGAGLGVFWGPQ